ELVLNDQERRILGLMEDRGVSLDELIQKSGLGASQVMATLSILEVRRLVRRQPGGVFVRP
ncbi:MAG: DNA-protecting protein DprA, partial [Isosphaeraceae bacterium]